MTSVVILAAGFGTRMKSSLAKPLHKISDWEMIFYSLENAFKLSDDVSVVLFNQAEKIQEKILSEFKNTKIVLQNMQFSGTGGALKNYHALYDEVLVLNADMPLVSLDSLKQLCTLDCDIAMSVFNKYEKNEYGKVVINDEKIVKIVENKDANEEEKNISLCNGGIYKFKKDILENYLPKLKNDNAQKEYYLTDIIKFAIDDGFLVKSMLKDENEFLGINSKKDLEQAQALHQKMIKEKLLQDGIIMHNKESIFISYKSEFIDECEIYPNCVFKGKNKIIKSVIYENTSIENSIVANSSIGPLARIRPKCDIKESKIGNFVECKNADLTKVKAGHLSYLGDCVIKSGVNIGCGVIICNYDGVKKHLSVINEDCFIGSNSNLIAPIEIAKNTLIAAGSTISNKDASKMQEKDLFLQRADARIISNFKQF